METPSRPEGFRQGSTASGRDEVMVEIASNQSGQSANSFACLARDMEEESHFPASPVSPRASVVDALEFDLTRRDTVSDDTMTEEVSGSDTDRIEFEDCGSVVSGEEVVAIVDPEPEGSAQQFEPLWRRWTIWICVTSSRGGRQ